MCKERSFQSGYNSQVSRTFFSIRVGSHHLGSGRQTLRIMALVHLLLPLLSLTCFYLIMRNSIPFSSDRLSSFLLLCKICKTIKSRRQLNRVNVLPQLLGNIILLAIPSFHFLKRHLFFCWLENSLSISYTRLPLKMWKLPRVKNFRMFIKWSMGWRLYVCHLRLFHKFRSSFYIQNAMSILK